MRMWVGRAIPRRFSSSYTALMHWGYVSAKTRSLLPGYDNKRGEAMKHLHVCKLKRLSKEHIALNSSMTMTECKLSTCSYHVDLLVASSSAHRAHPRLHAAP